MLLAGIDASLIQGHHILPEYAITTDHKNAVVSCWVPSRAKKTISISWQNSATFNHAIGGYVKVDGRDCKGEKPVPRGAKEERLHSEVFVSPTFTRPFVFSNLAPTAPKSPCSDPNCLIGLGEISLEIWEVTPVEAHSPPHFELPSLNICDRVRNELTHCVILGEERYVGVKSILKCIPVKRVATFVFKYRSDEKLREMGIIRDQDEMPASVPTSPRLRVETSQMRSSCSDFSSPSRSPTSAKPEKLRERARETDKASDRRPEAKPERRIEYILAEPLPSSHPHPHPASHKIAQSRKRRKFSDEVEVQPEKKIKSEAPAQVSLMSLGFVLR